MAAFRPGDCVLYKGYGPDNVWSAKVINVDKTIKIEFDGVIRPSNSGFLRGAQGGPILQIRDVSSLETRVCLPTDDAVKAAWLEQLETETKKQMNAKRQKNQGLYDSVMPKIGQEVSWRHQILDQRGENTGVSKTLTGILKSVNRNSLSAIITNEDGYNKKTRLNQIIGGTKRKRRSQKNKSRKN